jgi:hypothetical protein
MGRPVGPATGSVSAMAEYVTLEIADGIGTIRLDRPPMNALNRQVQEEIRDAARGATVDSSVKAVIVYGGEKVFAAGADIKEMLELTPAQMSAIIGDLQSALGALAAIPKPVVAAITGYALGGGLEVALGADRRIAGDNAKLGVPEILLGIIPGGGGTQRLARLVGPSKAKDMVFTGRVVGAAQARTGRRGRRSRRGLQRGTDVGVAVHEGCRACSRRREGVDRPGPRHRSEHRSEDRGTAVRRVVRDQGPHHRHGILRRQRAG